jgi:hypothetical protein
MALSIKLSYLQSKIAVNQNLDLNSLYEEATRQNLSIERWSRFLSDRFRNLASS